MPPAIPSSAILASPSFMTWPASRAPDDSTLVLDWSTAQDRLPDVFTDLAILPAHLLDTVPRDRLRAGRVE